MDILPCEECGGQNSLWAKVLWVEFTLGKVLVDKVPGFTSVVWGYNFAMQNKNILEKLCHTEDGFHILSKLCYTEDGFHGNTQSKHVA